MILLFEIISAEDESPNTSQVYKGKDEILLSKLILEPQHSILTQSYDSRLRMVRSLHLDQLSSITTS